MENFARELYLLEQRQHNLAQNLERKRQTAEAIIMIDQQRPAFLNRAVALGHILAQVKKIRIEVSVVMQEPVMKKAGC